LCAQAELGVLPYERFAFEFPSALPWSVAVGQCTTIPPTPLGHRPQSFPPPVSVTFHRIFPTAKLATTVFQRRSFPRRPLSILREPHLGGGIDFPRRSAAFLGSQAKEGRLCFRGQTNERSFHSSWSGEAQEALNIPVDKLPGKIELRHTFQNWPMPSMVTVAQW
jgi:hypothetical protein